MTYQFGVGDTVRLNGTYHEGEVIAVDARKPDVVLCRYTENGSRTEVYSPVKSLTLVRAASDRTEPSKPSNLKIETRG